MFDVGFIVLREVVVYIRRESGAARGLGEEGEREEVMRVQSRLRSGLIPSITETRSLPQHTWPRLRQPSKRSSGGSKERACAAKGMLFRGRDSGTAGQCSYALAPFYHSSTGGRKFAGQCGEPDGCNNHKRGN